MNRKRIRGWHRSFRGFLGRTLQAADENHVTFLASALTFDALLAAIPFVLLLLVGLTEVAQPWAGIDAVDLPHFFEAFLPLHDTTPGRDPFFLLEEILGRIAEYGSRLSLVAVPAFLWFSTRLFASIRTALNQMYDVSVRPPVRRHFLVSYLLSKLRDVVMVILTLGVFLLSTAVTTMVGLARAYGETDYPIVGFFFSSVGRWIPEALGLALTFTLFFLIYKYASLRRIDTRAALVASAFGAAAFDVAKRLFAMYLAKVASMETVALDFHLTAMVLTVLWVYYTSLVFLLGGVVAETWQLRTMQQQQRAQLT
ncbi:MAG TPA: YihY/virulence factor BrkB family protein [Gemmatimonadales bacterium]|nr:YihY/virulence factor BrkB family protein [Gemmatimonadales bacterium]